MPAARTALLLLTFAVLALAIAACGGSEVDYEQVPGPPANVPIPDDTSALDAGSGDAGSGADAGADPEATPTVDPDTGTVPPEDQSGDTGTNTAAGTDTGTAPPAPTGSDAAPTDSGGATAPAEPDSPTSDTPPPEGSEAQQFEDFCAQNPGAC